MNDDEALCAKKLEACPNVKRWVRNLDREPAGGFCLPLSPGRFFPDFVAELADGRIALIEHKGGHLAHDPHELLKKSVGDLWAKLSGGKAVFAWVVDREWSALAGIDKQKDTSPTA
jgi:type III restriction enzyme